MPQKLNRCGGLPIQLRFRESVWQFSLSWFSQKMSRRILPLSVLAIFWLGGRARGQTATTAEPPGDYLIDVWDSERGLPENSVVTLAQTPDGYCWLGTLQAGVARFDGVHFTTFDPANTPALQRIDIQRLMADSRARDCRCAT